MTNDLALLSYIFLISILPKHNAIKSTHSTIQPKIIDKCSEEWSSARLPRYITPLTYELTIIPSLPSNNSYLGLIKIVAKVNRNTSLIVLNLKDVEVISLTIEREVGERRSPSEVIRSISACLKFDQIHIKTENPYVEGSRIILRALYVGTLKESMHGIYRTVYGTNEGARKTTSRIISTQFEPDHAREAFPGFDEPSFKAIFRLRIGRPPSYISISNTARSSSITLKEFIGQPGSMGNLVKGLLVAKQISQQEVPNYMVDIYEPTPPMSTYLLAFVVCDYASVSGWTTTRQPIKVSLFAPPKLIDQVRFALNVTILLLEYYERFLSIPYPMPKIDLIGIPNFAYGAMENWGLITFRMVDLMFDPKLTPFSVKQRIVTVIAHELAHQWFGNLVTMRWWNDLWLNEGFASYMQYLATSQLFPTWRMMDQLVIDQMLASSDIDALTYSHSIVDSSLRDDVEGSKTPLLLERAFDTITYGKSSLILMMISNTILNQTTFRAGLIKYLAKYKFGSSTYSDLLECLDQYTNNLSMRKLMDPWLLQRGIPVLHVSDPVVRDGKTIINISQKLFSSKYKSPYRDLANSNCSRCNNCKEMGETWPLPVKYILSSDSLKVYSLFLGKNQASRMIILKMPELNTKFWLKCNYKYMGYYRTNYGPLLWENIKQQLYTDHSVFDPIDRINIIDDVFAMSKNGFLTANFSLELMSYVTSTRTRETDPLIIMMVIDIFMSHRHKIRDLKHWNPVIGRLLNPILNNVTDSMWQIDNPKDHLKSIMNAKVLITAILLGHNETVNRAKIYFAALQRDPATKINPNFINAIVMGIVKFGTVNQWMTIWALYLKTDVYSIKIQYLFALPSTKDPVLLTRLLEYSLDKDKIRPQDVITLMGKVASNHGTGLQLVWNFVRSHWGYLTKYVAPSVHGQELLLKAIVKHFSTQDHVEEFLSFYHIHIDRYLSSSMNLTMESLYLSMVWLERNRENIIYWVKLQASEINGHDCYYNLN